jgi:hypothetical protein
VEDAADDAEQGKYAAFTLHLTFAERGKQAVNQMVDLMASVEFPGL